MHILDSLLAFSAYFFIGVAMVIIFLFIYSKITPHNEWQLIKNNNTAASLAFSGTLLGYVIPLSSAAINAVSIPDYFAWGGIALVIQLLVFAGVRLYMPALSEKIINHNTAAGMFMGTAALAGGIFNAACMTCNGRSWPENANQEITVKLVTERSVALEDRIILLSRAAIATHKNT